MSTQADTVHPAHTLQELLEQVSNKSGDWLEALDAAQEIAVSLAPQEPAPPAVDRIGRDIYPASAFDVSPEDNPPLATHWMYQLGERWVAVEGWDADFTNWWEGSGVTPEEWMRRPIQQTPPMGTMAYAVVAGTPGLMSAMEVRLA